MDGDIDFMASLDEAAVVRQIIERQAFPPGVSPSGYSLTFGSDSTGRPAAWITFQLAPSYEQPTPEQMRRLLLFVTTLRFDLLDADLRFWPYISVDVKP